MSIYPFSIFICRCFIYFTPHLSMYINISSSFSSSSSSPFLSCHRIAWGNYVTSFWLREAWDILHGRGMHLQISRYMVYIFLVNAVVLNGLNAAYFVIMTKKLVHDIHARWFGGGRGARNEGGEKVGNSDTSKTTLPADGKKTI